MFGVLTRLRAAAAGAAWGLKRPKESAMALRATRSAPSAYCPACGYRGPFNPQGLRARPDARCSQCGSLERHRLFKLFLDDNPAEISGRSVLHFAPEPVVRRVVTAMAPARYVTADLFAPADLKLDIERIELDDGAFDTVICHHVLEHVDDRRALAELFRILAPGGALLAMVPVVEGWTSSYEPEGEMTAEDRIRVLGHPEHLRIYGRDFPDRMVAAGFAVSEYVADGQRSPDSNLLRGEKVFVGRRAPAI